MNTMNNKIDMEKNEKTRDMINKSRELVREHWYENKKGLSEEEEKILFREIEKYNEYGDSLYRNEDLLTLSKKMETLSQFAESFLNNNVEEAFDRVTINRNIKEVNKYIREFSKLAREMKEKEERLQALYEDIGTIFNRYFNISERDNMNFKDDSQL